MRAGLALISQLVRTNVELSSAMASRRCDNAWRVAWVVAQSFADVRWRSGAQLLSPYSLATDDCGRSRCFVVRNRSCKSNRPRRTLVAYAFATVERLDATGQYADCSMDRTA